MEKQTRRCFLKNRAKVGVAGTGGVLVTQEASAQMGRMVKKNATATPATPFPFTTVVSFGNLLFVSGIGCRITGTIEEETKWVLDEIEKNLVAAGSSLDKVLKVNVFLEDIKEFDRVNAVYKTREGGSDLPARNTLPPQ